MSRAIVSKHYAQLAARWPKDVIRPQVQFQKVLNARINAAPSTPPDHVGLLDQILPSRSPRAAELKEVNALYSLLENRYTKANPFPPAMMSPKSDPAYYTNLEKQLEETPDRSWFSNLRRRLGGMIRFK